MRPTAEETSPNVVKLRLHYNGNFVLVNLIVAGTLCFLSLAVLWCYLNGCP